MGDETCMHFPIKLLPWRFIPRRRALCRRTFPHRSGTRPRGLLTLFALFLNCWRSDSDLYLQSHVPGCHFYAARRQTRVCVTKYVASTVRTILEYTSIFLFIHVFYIVFYQFANFGPIIRYCWIIIFYGFYYLVFCEKIDILRKCLRFIRLRKTSHSLHKISDFKRLNVE